MKPDKTSGRRSLSMYVRWGVVIACAAFLAWRMIVVNLSEQLLRTGTPEAIEAALALSPENPNALYARASDIADADPEQAEQLLLQAIRLAPTKGHMFTLLGRLLEHRGEAERAEQAMLLADKLAPRNSAVQAALTDYWGRRNQPELYLRHLVTLIDLDYQYGKQHGKQLRLALMAVVDNLDLAALVRVVLSEAIADRAQNWWSRFFGYAAWKAKNLDAVRLLYSIRSGSYRGPTDKERRQFLARLERDGQWTEAYFIWLNALDDERLTSLGNIFNGPFSSPLMEEGFGWRYDDRDGVGVAIAATRGASDGRALRVRYSGRRSQVVHLSQFLMLPPGGYEFSGRVRTVAVDDGQGAQWRIKCVAPVRSPVTKGAYFSGTESWHVFAQRFEIPTRDCEVQQLYLAQESVTKEGKLTRGTLWFDDFAIRNLD